MRKKDWIAMERSLIDLYQWTDVLLKMDAYNDPDMKENDHQTRLQMLRFELSEFQENMDDLRYIYDRQDLEQ